MRILPATLLLLLSHSIACAPSNANDDATRDESNIVDDEKKEPGANVSSSASLAEVKRKIDDAARKNLADRGQVGMVVGIVNGEETAVWGYGETAIGSGRAPDGDTYFDIASVTKVYTTTLLALEVVRGKVALEDTVEKLWPELRGRPTGRMTLLELATFTSGLPADDLAAWAPADPDHPEAYNPLAGYDEAKLLAFLRAFQPTTSAPHPITYSNIGIGLLGHLLSTKLAKQTFAAYITKNLLEPLGMTRTKTALAPADLGNAAQGYDSVHDRTPYIDQNVLAGAGILKASAKDLLTFIRLQIAEPNDAFCAKTEERQQLCRASVLAQEPRVGGNSALVWSLMKYGPNQEHTLMSKDGADFGFTANLVIDRRQKKGIIALSNTTVRPEAIWTPLFGFDLPIAGWTPVSEAVAQSLSGTYVGGGFAAKVGRYNDGIFGVSVPGMLRQRLWAKPAQANASSPTEFVTRDSDRVTPLTFTTATNDSPARLTVALAEGAPVTLVRQ